MTNQLKDSIRAIEGLIRRLERLKPEDRLEALSNISECLESIQGMINGFHFWIQTPEFMGLFSEKETSGLFNSIREIAVELLRLGAKYARLVSSNIKTSQCLSYVG